MIASIVWKMRSSCVIIIHSIRNAINLCRALRQRTHIVRNAITNEAHANTYIICTYIARFPICVYPCKPRSYRRDIMRQQKGEAHRGWIADSGGMVTLYIYISSLYIYHIHNTYAKMYQRQSERERERLILMFSNGSTNLLSGGAASSVRFKTFIA